MSKHLIKSEGQILPFLYEGQQVLSNGLKKDTSRFAQGSTSSIKDITKGVKRPKNRAVQNTANRDNAVRKVIAEGAKFEEAKNQIDMFVDKYTTEEILNPPAFLQANVRKLQRQQEREAKKRLKNMVILPPSPAPEPPAPKQRYEILSIK